MSKYYVYFFLDPRKPGKYQYEGVDICFLYEPFYVGKGSGCRINHLTRKYNSSYHEVFCGVKAVGLSITPVKYVTGLSNQAGEELEKHLISKIGRADLHQGPLTNKTDGGVGGNGLISPIKGKTLEQIFGEEKAKELRPRFGSPGEKHPLFGVGHSEKSRRKIKENHYDCSGANNSKAKTWKIISPEGVNYTVKGTLRAFCKEFGISYNRMITGRGQGILPPTSDPSVAAKNTTGWSIVEIGNCNKGGFDV